MDDLALDVLAVYRLTRLLTTDVILDRPRAAIVRFAYETRDGYDDDERPAWWLQRVEADDEAPKIAELVTCRWCVSMWVAAAVVIVRRRRAWRPVRDVLALSALGTLLAGLEE